MLATFTVTTDADAPENTPAAIGTFRQAIHDADQTLESDTINFAANLNNQTITLTQGELSITNSVTIDARMLPLGLTIDGNDPDRNDPIPVAGNGNRIFNIEYGASSVKLLGPVGPTPRLRLTGGDPSDTQGGGAIRWPKEMGQNDFRSPVRLAVEGLKANCSDPFFTPHSKRETRAPQGVFTPDMTWRPLYFVQKANLSKSECNRYSI
jgi:hypothetical protein